MAWFESCDGALRGSYSKELQGHMVRHVYHADKRKAYPSVRSGPVRLFSCFPHVPEKRLGANVTDLRNLGRCKTKA